MKTVPTVRLADTADAAALPDLPEEIQLALADIAGAAREGLLAMSVAAGLAVMAAMFDAEMGQACGPKGRHDTKRAAVRHGAGRGSVTLGGRRVAVSRPRARTVDGHEVPLASYTHFAAEELLTEVVMERMLAGVATRRHARTAEPVSEKVSGTQKSVSKSAISRRFVRQTETALAELMARDLSELDIKVLMLDGEYMAERCVVVALAITADGRRVERAVTLDVPLYLAVGVDVPHIFKGHEELIGPMWSINAHTQGKYLDHPDFKSSRTCQSVPIAQSWLAFPGITCRRQRVLASCFGGNGSNNVGSVGVSIPTRYPDFGSPVSPSVLSAVIYGAHPKPVIAACARQKLGGAA